MLRPTAGAKLCPPPEGPMSDRRSRLVALFVLLVVVAAALAGGWLVTAAIDLPTGPEDYNLVQWEVRHLPNKWLYQVGTLLRGGPGEAEKTRRVERFLAVNGEIASLEQEAAQARCLGELSHSRASWRRCAASETG